PDALTLILMHGFSGNITNFNNVWDALIKVHQILAFDRPGWGLSPRVHRLADGTWPTDSGENPYTYDYSRKLLRALREALELTTVYSTLVLMGHSHGGATTAAILCNHDYLRSIVAGAILIDAPLLAWPVPRCVANFSRKAPHLSAALVNWGAGVY